MTAEVGVGGHRTPSRGLHDLEQKRALGAAETQAAVAGQAPRLEAAVGTRPGRADAEPLTRLELQVAADVRVQAPDGQLQAPRRTRWIQAALLGGDLVRVRRLRIVLLGELESPSRGGGPRAPPPPPSRP
jgi:hypothetical protein